jgi:hypothetical protein
MTIFMRMTLILIITISTSFARNDSANDDRAHSKKPIYHVYDDVDLIPSTRLDSNKSPKMSIKIVYPKLEADSDNSGVDGFNSAVNETVSQLTIDFKNEVMDNASRQTDLPKELRKNTLSVDYNSSVITANQDHIISVRFRIQSYISGMSHPARRFRVLNYNLDSNEYIELRDLFQPESDYLQLFSDYAQKELARKLPDLAMLQSGSSPNPQNYVIWNLKPNGILITFEEGQVAPSVYGAQTLLIPYAILKNIISQDSLLMKCISKQKCVTKNLLTGGFIDEA